MLLLHGDIGHDAFAGAQTLSVPVPGRQQLQGWSAGWVSMNKAAEDSLQRVGLARPLTASLSPRSRGKGPCAAQGPAFLLDKVCPLC